MAVTVIGSCCRARTHDYLSLYTTAALAGWMPLHVSVCACVYACVCVCVCVCHSGRDWQIAGYVSVLKEEGRNVEKEEEEEEGGEFEEARQKYAKWI